jgi:hypothetical protein
MFLPLAPAAQYLGVGLRRPCWGQARGDMLEAMTRIASPTRSFKGPLQVTARAFKSVQTSDEVPIPRRPYAQHPWLSHAPTHGSCRRACEVITSEVQIFDVRTRSCDLRRLVPITLNGELLRTSGVAQYLETVVGYDIGYFIEAGVWILESKIELDFR